MKKWAVLAGAGLCAVALTTAVMTADETITGRLVEAGCATMAGDNPSPEHVACMVRCAQAGEAIGILTDNGLYKITGDWAASHPDDLAALMAKAGARHRRDQRGGRRAVAGGDEDRAGRLTQRIDPRDTAPALHRAAPCRARAPTPRRPCAPQTDPVRPDRTMKSMAARCSSVERADAVAPPGQRHDQAQTAHRHPDVPGNP